MLVISDCNGIEVDPLAAIKYKKRFAKCWIFDGRHRRAARLDVDFLVTFRVAETIYNSVFKIDRVIGLTIGAVDESIEIVSVLVIRFASVFMAPDFGDLNLGTIEPICFQHFDRLGTTQ